MGHWRMLCILPGIATIVIPLLRRWYVMRRYEPVEAVCIGVKYKPPSCGEDSAAYYPIWQFSYQGETITSMMSYGTSTKDFSEGDEQEIYVNPKKPTQIYVPSKSTLGFLIAFGLLWVVMVGFSAIAIAP